MKLMFLKSLYLKLKASSSTAKSCGLNIYEMYVLPQVLLT